MGPIGHTVASLGVGTAVWTATGSVLAIPVAFAAGVLPDLDHVLDFFEKRGSRLQRLMIRPFHGWEIALISLAVVLSFNSGDLFLAAALGYLSHVAIDQLANQVHPLGYWMLYRASKGFKRRHLTPHVFDPSYQALRASMPLWGKLEPSVWRLVTKLRREEH